MSTRDTRGMRGTRDTTRPPQVGTGHGQGHGEGHGLNRAAYDELKPQLLLATIAALLIGVAYLLLPPALRVGSTVLPSWLLLAVDAVVLLPLLYSVYFRPLPHTVGRLIRTGLQVVLTLALLSSVALLALRLPGIEKGGGTLLRSAALLWASNVLIFAVWYWEIDGDGPVVRHTRGHAAVDFQFPQQMSGARFAPGFVDYLFLAFCSATALSPADTMPLTQRAKLLMMAEAILSLVLLVLLIGRSVNIL
jgi:hypothetical protein